ncbi:unnamed protein product [Euphydryas editha]|uniref:Uncharacterized protein n=1 Tax=Euphydryas editha TaxID=104508 RepID=A0AAU9TBE9_EUPED|nr:unnamed protein product [Euphydryas editha]
MGINRKSHGKKSDKETQSPVLKIFKDIMQKENTDPEKVNLLKDKKREKRRKTHLETRQKSDQRNYDSSSTDRYRTNDQTKITVQDIQEDKNAYYNRSKSDINAFQGEKRESWWFWGDQNQKKQKRTEDTCSCVSCALKKIVGSEYTCVACLFILFSISVAIIFITVCKTMTFTDTGVIGSDNDEGLVKKIKMLKEKRQLTEGYGWSDYTERFVVLHSLKDHCNE